jgi:PAS domain S-box-containing protein
LIRNKPFLFSTYLSIWVALLVTGSVILVSNVLYLYFTQRLESEFEKKISAQKGQAETILKSRLADIEESLTALSTDNSLRVAMMMGDTIPLAAKAKQFHSDIPGVSYFVKKAGQPQIYPMVHPDRSDQILALAGAKGEIVEENGQTRLLWWFEAPIMHQEERMGKAFAIYDMTQDRGLINKPPRIIRDTIFLLMQDSLMPLIGDNALPLDTTSLKAISGGSGFIHLGPDGVVIPLDGFQNLYFSTSRKELIIQQRNVAQLIVIFTLCVLAVSILSTIPLSKSLIRPLSDMATKAQHISSGQRGVNFQINRSDCLEFQRLSQVFNEMLNKLNEMEEKNRFTELMENVDDAVYLVDTKGKIIQANEATLLQVGHDRNTPLNLNIDTILPENDARIILSLLDNNQNPTHSDKSLLRKTIETFHIDRDGDSIPVEIRARAIPYQGQNVVLNVARDISTRKASEQEKKHLEAQLVHAQKMEAIGTLAGGVAHDFNNLLQVIHGYTELLVTMKDENDPELNHLKEIINASQRASDLTEQLLTFSRKTESNPMPVNLNDEVEQGCRLLKRTFPNTVEIEHQLADDLKMISAARGQIQQVVLNLGVNARDAMPEGGRLIIETMNVSLDENLCKNILKAIPGDYVRLSVTDTGHGMDTETIEHIFDPFFTTKDTGKGTGLGLAIVYGIVQDIGGFINCYSEPDMGTTIRVYFPETQSKEMPLPLITDDAHLKKFRVPSDKRASVINNPKWRGLETILLVDDEERILNLCVSLLSPCGYTVLSSNNGVEALSIYQTRREEIDLVILDMIMPEMDGYKCFQKLKEINPNIDVIMSSGYSVSRSSLNLDSKGVRAFIDKPYQLEEMLKTIRNTLDKQAQIQPSTATH